MGFAGYSAWVHSTIIGRVVNLAARLMQAAGEHPEVLCDEETARASKGCFRFESLAPRRLQHIEGLVPIFRPLEETVDCRGPRTTIGRQVERATLLDRLEGLRSGRGGVVVLEGEPSIGKSQLIADPVGRAEVSGVSTLVGGLAFAIGGLLDAGIGCVILHAARI
jgi:hypothetical protein